jgi:hypothetical protein
MRITPSGYRSSIWTGSKKKEIITKFIIRLLARSGGLDVALGPDAEKLIQAYAVEAAKAEAQRQGYSVWEETLEDGGIQLHVQTEG